MSQVVFEQAEAHGVQRFRGRGDLGEDVDAVLVLLDHAGDAADLTLDAAQTLQVGVLGGSVAVRWGGFGGVHAAIIYPLGVLSRAEVTDR